MYSSFEKSQTWKRRKSYVFETRGEKFEKTRKNALNRETIVYEIIALAFETQLWKL